MAPTHAHMQGPFNLKFTFDNNLREVLENPDDVFQYIIAQRKKLSTITDPEEQVQILGNCGAYFRMLENYEESIECLKIALETISTYNLNLELWAANNIRLAHTYQWNENFNDAKDLLIEMLALCKEADEASKYLHFVYQHLGKLYFQLKNYPLALEYFKHALEIRKKLNDISLIKSTQFAIDITNLKLKKNNIIVFPSHSQIMTHSSDLNTPSSENSETLNELNKELKKKFEIKNNSAESDFLGLSPNDMHILFYSKFQLSDNILFSYKKSEESKLLEIPLIQESLFFLNHLQNNGPLKKTNLGNLPKAFVLEYYYKFNIPSKYSIPNKEADWPPSTRIHFLLNKSGYLKSKGKSISITKKGEKLLKTNNLNELYENLFNHLFNSWNWAFTDRYSEYPIIQNTGQFSLFIIHKKAQNLVSSKELADILIKAFPMILNNPEPYTDPKEDAQRCYKVRFLLRTCIPLGIITHQEKDKPEPRVECFQTTDFFKNHFSFKI